MLVAVRVGACVYIVVVHCSCIEGEFWGVGSVDSRCCDEVMAVDQDECL